MRANVAWMAAAILLGSACSDSAVGPTTQQASEQRKTLAAKVEKDKVRKATRAAAAPKAVARAAEPVEASFGVMEVGFSYDGANKRDPFRSFEWDRLAKEEPDARGPLEQFDVSQLSLIAVVWKTGTARALVQDPAGQAYVIAQGTKVGKNAGRVIAIDDNLVVVKETYVDYLGQETTKDIEMRIRRSEGG